MDSRRSFTNEREAKALAKSRLANNDRQVRWGLTVQSEETLPPVSRSHRFPQKGALKRSTFGHPEIVISSTSQVHLSVNRSSNGTDIQDRHSPSGTRRQVYSTTVRTSNEVPRHPSNEVPRHSEDLSAGRRQPYHESCRHTESAMDLQGGRQARASAINTPKTHPTQAATVKKSSSTPFSSTTMRGMNHHASGDLCASLPLRHRPFRSFRSVSTSSIAPSLSTGSQCLNTEKSYPTGSYFEVTNESDSDAHSFEDALTSFNHPPNILDTVAAAGKNSNNGTPVSAPSLASAAATHRVDAKHKVVDAPKAAAQITAFDQPLHQDHQTFNQQSQSLHQDSQTFNPKSQTSIHTTSIHTTLTNPVSVSSSSTSSILHSNHPTGQSQMNDQVVRFDNEPRARPTKGRSLPSCDFRMPGRYFSIYEDADTCIDISITETEQTSNQSDDSTERLKDDCSSLETHRVSFTTPSSSLIDVLNRWEKIPITAEVPLDFVNQLRQALDLFDKENSTESDDQVTSSLTGTSVGYPSSLGSSSHDSFEYHPPNSNMQHSNSPNDGSYNLPKLWTPFSERSRVPSSRQIGGKAGFQAESPRGHLPGEKSDSAHKGRNSSSLHETMFPFASTSTDDESTDSHVKMQTDQRRRKKLEAFFGARLGSPSQSQSGPDFQNLELPIPQRSEDKPRSIAAGLVKTVKGLKSSKLAPPSTKTYVENLQIKPSELISDCNFHPDPPKHHARSKDRHDTAWFDDGDTLQKSSQSECSEDF